MGYVGNAVLCHKVNIDETCIPSPWNRSPVPVTSGLVFSLSCRDRFLPVPIPRFERYSNTGSFPMSCYWSLNDWPLVHSPPPPRCQGNPLCGYDRKEQFSTAQVYIYLLSIAPKMSLHHDDDDYMPNGWWKLPRRRHKAGLLVFRK